MSAHDSLCFPSRFFFSLWHTVFLNSSSFSSSSHYSTSLPSFFCVSAAPPPCSPPFFSPSLLAAVPKWAGRARQTHHRAEQRAIRRLADSSRARLCFEPSRWGRVTLLLDVRGCECCGSAGGLIRRAPCCAVFDVVVCVCCRGCV